MPPEQAIDMPLLARQTVDATASGQARIVLLFMLCYVAAQADKQALGLVLAAIQADLHISDAQIGLLQGAIFAIAFALGGIPLGWMVDRWNRIRIAAVCVICWSIATAACGIVNSFAMLAVMRAVTAFTEAGLGPAAFSVFSDTSEGRTPARATATFMLAPFLGAGVAMIGGALVARYVPHWSLAAQLGWDDMWRLMFLFIGAPGIVLGLLLWFLLKEPARTAQDGSHRVAPIKWREVLNSLFDDRRFLLSFQLSMACFGLFLSGYIAWFPTHLIRSYGLDVTTTGAAVGATYMTSGIAGTIFTIRAAGKTARDLPGTIRWLLIAIALLVPVAILLPIVPWFGVAIALYGVFAFLAAMVFAVMVVPLQIALPIASQGRAVGVFLLLVNGVASSLGPLLVGMLSGYTSVSLGTALCIVGTVGIGGALGLILRATHKLQHSPSP
jgi:MFS family permease